MMHLCKVCSEQTPKYRCPACDLRYCSLSCYKKHKDSCLPAKKCISSETKDTASAVQADAQPANKWSVEDLLPEDDATDLVPLEKLQLLGQSTELKNLLCNPHLRELLRTIDSADSKEAAMKAAMQEPLFVEFADQCLTIVEKEAHSQEFS